MHRRSCPLPSLPAALTLAAALAGGADHASAAIVSWNAPVDGLWSEGGNWSTNNPPGPGDVALIDVDGIYTITLDVDASIGGLAMGGASGTQNLVSAGHSLTISDPSTVGALARFELSDGSVTGTGSLASAGVIVLDGNATIAVPLDNAGSILVHNHPNTVSGAYTSRPGSSVHVDGWGSTANAAITFATGFVNQGALDISEFAPANLEERIEVLAGTLLNSHDGGIYSEVGNGGTGTRVLAAELENQGTVYVRYPLRLEKPGAQHRNFGTIRLLEGDLAIAQSGAGASFENDGTFDLSPGRTLSIDGGGFNHDQGTIQGSAATLVFTNCNLSTLVVEPTWPKTVLGGNGGSGGGVTAAGIGNHGTVVVRGQPNSADDFFNEMGGTLRVDAAGGVGNAVLSVGFRLRNEGTIQLVESEPVGAEERIQVGTGRVENYSNGLIRSLPGAGTGTRFIDAELENLATMEVLWPLTVGKPSAQHTNAGTTTIDGDGSLTIDQPDTGGRFKQVGTLSIAPGRSCTVKGAAADFAGAVLTGPGGFLISTDGFLENLVLTASSPTLVLSPSADGPPGNSAAMVDNGGMVIARGGFSQLFQYTSRPGSTLRLDPAGGASGANVHVRAEDFTNHGLIELTESDAAGVQELLEMQGKLVNAMDGVITSTPGLSSSGTHLFSGELENHGRISVTWPLQLFGGPITNAADGVIEGTSELQLHTGPLVNLGITRPGTSPGLLMLSGEDQRGPSSVLEIEIAGPSGGNDFDRLQSGREFLDGTLDVRLLGGFVPTAGEHFPIIDADHEGAFANVAGTVIVPGELEWRLVYEPQRIDLVAVATGTNQQPYFEGFPDPPDSVEVRARVGVMTSFYLCAIDQDPGDIVSWVADGLPPGTIPVPVQGNPACTQINLTPQPGDEGTRLRVTLLATDLAGAKDTALVVFFVENTTATLLERFDAEPRADGVELTWRFGGDSRVVSQTVERSASPDGPWTPLDVEVRESEGAMRARDATAAPGATYYYRLVTVDSDGDRQVFGPLTVTVPIAAPVAFALGPPAPNPARSSAWVDFDLPREAAVVIDVLDVAGREVAVLERGTFAPGRHRATWIGTIGGSAARPGLYFVRYRAPGFGATRRLVLAP